MLNHIVLQGRLGNQPELKTTQNGVEVTTATLAVDRDFKNKSGERETDWIPLVSYKGTATFLSKYFTKGQQIIVSGRLQVRKYTTQNGEKRSVFEVVADNVYFAGKNEKPLTGQASGLTDDFQEITADDELPF